MIRAFLDRQLPVEEFERRYLAAFKEEPAGMDEELYSILDSVFGAVDAYWPECQPGQETAFEISEQRLREEVSAALVRLDRWLAGRWEQNPQGNSPGGETY
jgi:hypothetical protein